MFYCLEFHLGRYNCARKIKYVLKLVSLFIYYLLAYLFRDTVCVRTVTSNGRKTGDYGIGQEVAGGRRGVHRYLILLRH